MVTVVRGVFHEKNKYYSQVNNPHKGLLLILFYTTFLNTFDLEFCWFLYCTVSW